MGYKEECSLSILCAVVGEDCKSDFDSYGGFVLWALFVLYTFKILAEVCDGHLTSVLELIVDRFGVSEDVAGATFLAMSSSAPEVFSALVATFVIVSPTGVGNIVGSALFNLLCIIGVLPLCSKTGPLHIWWYPTVRDTFFYSVAVGELYIFIQDGEVVAWEASVMVASYACYVVYFMMNARILEYTGWEPPVRSDQAGFNTPKLEDTVEPTEKSPFPSEGENSRETERQTSDAVPSSPVTPLADALKKVLGRSNSGVSEKSAKSEESNPKKKVLGRSNSGVSSATSHLSSVPTIPDEIGSRGTPREEDKTIIKPVRSMEGVQVNFDRSSRKFQSVFKKSHSKVLGTAAVPRQVSGESEKSKLEIGKNIQQPVIQGVQDQDIDLELAAAPEVAKESEKEPEPVLNTIEEISEEEEDPPGPCTKYDPSLILIDKTMPSYDWMLTAFAVVVGWVALYTYFMVDAANRFGCFIDFPHVPMGLIVLAAGTSIPDMIASMSVAAAGCADMAAANAVGSNTFDILVGLGLPWMIRTLSGYKVEVPVAELNESIMILGGALVTYVSLLLLKKGILDRKLGAFLLCIYSGAIFFILYRHYTHFEGLQH